MKIDGRSNYKAGSKDECGSPPYSIAPIIDYIQFYFSYHRLLQNDFSIWEPATHSLDGQHKHLGLVEGLTHYGYNVIYGTGDFLTADIETFPEPIGLIVTNPPFSVKLKKEFIKKCNLIYQEYNIPFALLMKATTIVEKTNREHLQGCSMHIPNGRINYNMPNKGWGSKEEPTKSTFETAWFTKGLVAHANSILYDNFPMSDHFQAMEDFFTEDEGI